MRTTLTIDDALLERVRTLTGLTEPTQLIRAALDALIERESRLMRRDPISNERWTDDMRSEARRQAHLVAQSDKAGEDQGFIDAISEPL